MTAAAVSTPGESIAIPNFIALQVSGLVAIFVISIDVLD